MPQTRSTRTRNVKNLWDTNKRRKLAKTVVISSEEENSEDEDSANSQSEPSSSEDEEEVDEEQAEIEDLKCIEKILKKRKSDHPRTVEYFVKWKNWAYVHCSWVAEEKLLKAVKIYPANLLSKVKKFKYEGPDKEFENGFDPEFLEVDRVIGHQSKTSRVSSKLLIKWKGLYYDEVTWEAEEDCQKYEGFNNAYEKYKERKSLYELSLQDKSSKLDPFRRFQYGRREALNAKYKETPKFLCGELFPYQLEGLNWLLFSWQVGRNVILGDEMGLGKTVQAISYIASLHAKGCTFPHIIVVPLSTLLNWEREFGKWAPNLNVITYVGNQTARKVIREHELFVPGSDVKHLNSKFKQSKKIQTRVRFHVLLTTYEVALVDSPYLKRVKYGSLIVDEGHRLKNRASKLFECLVDFQVFQRILLTGTPLQNNLEELFMLMHFVDPSKFDLEGIPELLERYSTIGQKEQIEEIHQLLKPHLLRRMKKDVLKQLPPKKEQIILVEMSPEQKDLYKATLTQNYGLLSSQTVLKSGLKNLLMQLRHCCNHPSLVTQDFKSLSKKRIDRFTKMSGKFVLLERILGKLIPRGHRILIYSQFTTVIDMIQEWLELKGLDSLTIDGSVKGKVRQQTIDKFNSQPDKYPIFLLSTRAGGQGINLATADTVLIFDSDWNPHNDIQAQARAHRLGQKKEVMIYRFVNRATVEERIVQQAKKKMVLEHIVVRKEDLNQKELDDILRHGVAELFDKDNFESAETGEGDEIGGKKGGLVDSERKAGRYGGKNQKIIHYDEEALEKLLNRDLVWKEAAAEKTENSDDSDNDYLEAFKVADFELQAENYQAQHEKGDFWKSLLKDAHNETVKEDEEVLGKGKRARKTVKYAGAEDDPKTDNDYQIPDDSDSSDDDSDTEASSASDEEDATPKRSPSVEKEETVVFSKKDSIEFYSLFMKFGAGKMKENEKGFEFERIKVEMKKSDKEIQSYGEKFLDYLSEDNPDSETFSGGVSKRDIFRSSTREDILTRMGIIHLIKEKVLEADSKPERAFNCLVKGKYMRTRIWKPYMDLNILRGILKHGYGSLVTILEDQTLGILPLMVQELNADNMFTGVGQTPMPASVTQDFYKKARKWLGRRVEHLCKGLVTAFEHGDHVFVAGNDVENIEPCAEDDDVYIDTSKTQIEGRPMATPPANTTINSYDIDSQRNALMSSLASIQQSISPANPVTDLFMQMNNANMGFGNAFNGSPYLQPVPTQVADSAKILQTIANAGSFLNSQQIAAQLTNAYPGHTVHATQAMSTADLDLQKKLQYNTLLSNLVAYRGT